MAAFVGSLPQHGPQPRVGAVELTARHCWVVDAPGLPPGRWPGLLHRWQQGSDGWSGQVMVIVLTQRGQIVVQAEIASQHLRPAT